MKNNYFFNDQGVNMYLVVVYDVQINRVNNVNKFLKEYLHWQQNSVFEGKVTQSQYDKIIAGLYD